MLKVEEIDKKETYFLLPSLITYSNMVLGMVAIYISKTSNIKMIKIGCILVLIAAITDKLDGFVARKLNMSSEFGKELDSLCDIVSFGLAPVIIGWNMKNGGINILEIITSIIFIGAGIFRLARFNTSKDKIHIIGLPITIAGAIMVLKYLIDIKLRPNLIGLKLYDNIILMLILSFLMVSKFKVKKPNI